MSTGPGSQNWAPVQALALTSGVKALILPSCFWSGKLRKLNQAVYKYLPSAAIL